MVKYVCTKNSLHLIDSLMRDFNLSYYFTPNHKSTFCQTHLLLQRWWPLAFPANGNFPLEWE